MVYGLPDVSKLELLFAFTSHVQTHAPAMAFARLAVTLWQSYMFKETSVRGATCGDTSSIVGRLQPVDKSMQTFYRAQPRH